MNYTAAGAWLILVAIAMFAVSYLPRVRDRVRAERNARLAWEAQLRADAALRALERQRQWALTEWDVALAEAEAVLDEAYTYIAAREAAQLDAEWKRAQG